MNSSEKKEVLKAKRRERQTKVRQALLINEYIFTKYLAIYQEAARYYNQLNTLHPTKKDLRKCKEFKAWKTGTNQYTPTRSYPKVYHSNIPMEQLELPVQTDLSEQQLEISVQADSEQPELSVQTDSEQLEISVQADSEQPELSVQTDSEQPELSVQTDSEQPEQTNSEQPEQPEQANPGKKVMELKIPLMAPSVVTETLQILTQEIIQEKASEGITEENTTIHPSLHEELPQDIIDRIINELREDPELKTIMNDIEQDIEIEQIGMDLDIFEDNRLEDELENMALW